MQLTINVPDQIAEQARARGLVPEKYVEELLTRVPQPVTKNPQAAKDAVEAIRQLRKGVRLDGLKIKDLAEEGRKY